MSHEPLDVVAALILILTIVTSKDVAVVLGPYAAIVVAASAGSAISLYITNRDMQRWWQPTFYVLSRILIATVFTVAIAKLLHGHWPGSEISLLVIVVAASFGLVWDYGACLRWIVTALRKALPGWLANLGKRDG